MTNPIDLSDILTIESIDLSRLRNEEHFQFMEDALALVKANNPETLNVAQLVPIFTDLLDQEAAGIEALEQSSLTKPIADADHRRDRIIRGFTLCVEGRSYGPTLVQEQAAAKIQTVLNHYGDFRNHSYNEESAIITNLLQDMRKHCAAELQELNLDDWLEKLATSNQEFEILMAQRFNEQAEQKKPNVAEMRKSLDKVYKRVVERVQSSIVLNGPEAYANFVGQLNERISYFKTTLARRKGRALASRERAASKEPLRADSRGDVNQGC